MKKPKKDCNIQRIKKIFAAGQFFAIDLYKKGYLEENIIQHCLNSMGSMCLAIMQEGTEFGERLADGAAYTVMREMTRMNRSKRVVK